MTVIAEAARQRWWRSAAMGVLGTMAVLMGPWGVFLPTGDVYSRSFFGIVTLIGATLLGIAMRNRRRLRRRASIVQSVSVLHVENGRARIGPGRARVNESSENYFVGSFDVVEWPDGGDDVARFAVGLVLSDAGAAVLDVTCLALLADDGGIRELFGAGAGETLWVSDDGGQTSWRIPERTDSNAFAFEVIRRLARTAEQCGIESCDVLLFVDRAPFLKPALLGGVVGVLLSDAWTAAKNRRLVRRVEAGEFGDPDSGDELLAVVREVGWQLRFVE